jgi:hypothetical protein
LGDWPFVFIGVSIVYIKFVMISVLPVLYFDVCGFCDKMPFEAVQWTFYGYVTPAGGKDVQDWFDELPEESRTEAKEVLGYLQALPRHLWKKPEFELLDHDISEIRFKVNVEHEQHIYRIYGAFWPEHQRHSFTFLVGKDKKIDNDRRGKKEAIKRLKKLKLPPASNERGSIHEFEFEGEFDRAPAEGEGGAHPVH